MRGIEKLCEGSGSVVLKVAGPPGPAMAMTIALPHVAGRKAGVADFLRETRLQATLEHRNVVRASEAQTLLQGTEQQGARIEGTKIEEKALDASLFVVPAGDRRVTEGVQR